MKKTRIIESKPSSPRATPRPPYQKARAKTANWAKAAEAAARAPQAAPFEAAATTRSCVAKKAAEESASRPKAWTALTPRRHCAATEAGTAEAAATALLDAPAAEPCAAPAASKAGKPAATTRDIFQFAESARATETPSAIAACGSAGAASATASLMAATSDDKTRASAAGLRVSESCHATSCCRKLSRAADRSLCASLEAQAPEHPSASELLQSAAQASAPKTPHHFRTSLRTSSGVGW